MPNIQEAIHQGMARAIFVSQWADFLEETDETPAGQDLMTVSPATTRSAENEAWRILGVVEQANAMHITALLWRAAKADGVDPESGLTEDYAREFGHFLAMQVMGHGVAWTDDHADAGITVPSREPEEVIQDAVVDHLEEICSLADQEDAATVLDTLVHEALGDQASRIANETGRDSDEVYDEFSARASAINNDGRRAQAAFLVGYFGPAEATHHVIAGLADEEVPGPAR